MDNGEMPQDNRTADDKIVNSGEGDTEDPTREELIEKLKAREELVEQQRQSLDEKDEKIKNLQRKYARAKQMFKNEWDDRKAAWTILEVKANLWTEKGDEIVETLHGLRDDLDRMSREGGVKLEEIKMLRMKLEELENGKKVKAALKVVVGKDAAAIFPEEVWRMILGNVPDPSDLWNLTNTCHLFDSILSSWKTGWMLAQALPYIYKDLPLEKYLECRLVCRSWKDALSNFLEEHPSVRPHNIDRIDPRKLDYVDPMKELKLRDLTITFYHVEENSYEDPWIPEPSPSSLPGRYLKLELDLREYKQTLGNEDEDIRKLIDKVRSFLSSVGNQIWYLSICLRDSEEGGILHPRIVQFVTIDMLALVPNLRELSFGLTGEPMEPIPLPNSLPPAPHLETLQASYPNTDQDPLITVLMKRYHTQLRKLHLNVSATSFPELSRLNWPNLVELHLFSIEGLSHLRGLSYARMPNLTKLGLNLENVTAGSDSTFEELTVLTRRLCSSSRLHTIRLDGGVKLVKVGVVQGFWNHKAHPSIKTLEVDASWDCWVKYDDEDEEQNKVSPPSYTFLLQHFPFIENLHLYWRKSYKTIETEIDLRSREKCQELAVKHGFHDNFEIVDVHKYAYRGQMYRSNIWELLHELKVLTFQWDVYTRQGYEAYRNKAGNKK